MPGADAKKTALTADQVQRSGPFGEWGQLEMLRLRLSQIHPVVRIAHRQAAGMVIPERIIFDHELVLIMRGRGKWESEGVGMSYAPHDLLFVPPFTPHAFHGSEEESEHLAIHFDFVRDVPSQDETLGARSPYGVNFTHGLKIARQQSLFEGHRLIHELMQVVKEHQEDDDLSLARASMRLGAVLLDLLKTEPQRTSRDSQGSKQDKVGRVIEHMREHIAKPLDHASFEAVAHVGTSRLQVLFREVTGYSPLDYLRRLRVKEARRLLAEPRYSVKEVAALTGFRDTSHLSKVFRRIDGLSPAHYREALLAGRQEKSATPRA